MFSDQHFFAAESLDAHGLFTKEIDQSLAKSPLNLAKLG